MDIDKIALITLLVIMILFGITTIVMYLLIVGADMCKTDEERKIEDDEQMKYFRNYQNGKGSIKHGRCNK